MTLTDTTNFAEMLAGCELAGGWTVGGMVPLKPNGTGGCFSTGYHVENKDGRKGFLKAIDFLSTIGEEDAVDAQKTMLDSYTFERDICNRCMDMKIKRVVSVIGHGEVFAVPGLKFSKVVYLIFELAKGNIRNHLDEEGFDLAFALRAVHHVANGLEQLHHADIAHQDLKPSNILVFDDQRVSKIGDFGRAWSKGIPAPHDGKLIAGQKIYAPLELLFNQVDIDEKRRRFSCDMYHLGSLIAFLFTRVQFNGMISEYFNRLPLPGDLGGTYQDVLPYLQAAFGEALSVIGSHVPPFIRDDVVRIVSQMCEPDRSRRGHPENRKNNAAPYSLERYVSQLDALACRARVRFMGGGSIDGRD